MIWTIVSIVLALIILVILLRVLFGVIWGQATSTFFSLISFKNDTALWFNTLLR